ncbi:DUF6390 family protein [Nostocoides sp. F2B08]|uniref:DUF6390 family protein n=1 Tax=Nostocoides sp. F2B08 TaxID=2653936 RepID=UPI001D054D03|nr:DUF6390 family protein [Tetrasphaera sp. F2B08]
MIAALRARSGPALFARYAYPPNALGYCGPGGGDELLAELSHHEADGGDDRGLRNLAQGFEGAWPYLQLIAAANGRADPLDPDVVSAYWVGNRLLDAVSPALLFRSMEERFADRAGASWAHLRDGMTADAVPHHDFHVFAVYPWVGLLRTGRLVDEPLHVLDRCRIRSGTVLSVDGHEAEVRYRPLTYDGHHLGLGPDSVDVVMHLGGDIRPGSGGDRLRAGDVVAMHWQWVCQRLDPASARWVQVMTARMLAVANAPTVPGAAALLG